MTDKALDERRNHVSNDLYHFEIKKSLEFFTSKFYPIWRSMLCDVVTESKITWRYIRLLFNQTRQKLILLRFMIETNLFSLAASVMSSNLCWGSSILKNPSLNTLERERAKIPSAIYHEQLFSLLGINEKNEM